MSLFFPFLSLWKGQSSTNLLGHEVAEWLWKFCFITIFASLTQWPAILLCIGTHVHPSLSAALTPLGRCREPERRSRALPRQRTCVPPSLGDLFLLPPLTCPFCRDRVPFHVQGLQGLVSKPKERSRESSWSKVFACFSLNIKHSAMSSQKWTHEGGNRTDPVMHDHHARD